MNFCNTGKYNTGWMIKNGMCWQEWDLFWFINTDIWSGSFLGIELYLNIRCITTRTVGLAILGFMCFAVTEKHYNSFTRNNGRWNFKFHVESLPKLLFALISKQIARIIITVGRAFYCPNTFNVRSRFWVHMICYETCKNMFHNQLSVIPICYHLSILCHTFSYKTYECYYSQNIISMYTDTDSKRMIGRQVDWGRHINNDLKTDR